jgi:hypothetical protein
MDKGFYPWDSSKKKIEGWNKYGILVNGEKDIIDNPPQRELPKPVPAPVPASVTTAAATVATRYATAETGRRKKYCPIF